MPDWFYRTVSRPLLYRLPVGAARSLAIGFMGRLARLPLGGTLIDLLGHMRADSRLATTVLGVNFASPIGLGPGLDPEAQALPAFARFGVGFIDFGEVALAPQLAEVGRDDARQSITFSHPPRMDVAAALPKLRELSTTGLPILVRIHGATDAERQELIAKISPCCSFVACEVPCPPDCLGIVRNPSDLVHLHSCRGVLVDVSTTEVGSPSQELALKLVAAIRERDSHIPILVRGGVHEVADALALHKAGANLIEVDSGLVFAGPGLVKSINEAFLFEQLKSEPAEPPVRAAHRSWFWTFLMGLGMLIGAVLALGIASTRVVLPYDEQYIGMTCNQLREMNPRLLAFLAHDRVTLSGTMLGIGIFYVGLSYGAIRHGQHWAQIAVRNSCVVGFLTFFLFLGFGYLDTLHAFVTAVLFQFMLMSIFADLGPATLKEPPPLRTNFAWRLSLWGQLLLVGHGIAVMVAGTVIGGYGVTVVFVPEDLAFMRTTSEALAVANPKLLPMIAHDRATFGGTLVCFGLCQLLTTLWGIRANQPWLWWTLFLAGLGYLPAIFVHHIVGYDDLWHLIPAYFGLVWYFVGVGLLWHWQVGGSQKSSE